MSPGRGELARLGGRFREELARTGLAPGARVLVAVSGGLDSVALLHLARFGARAGALEVRAAHFDHGMRPSSVGDSDWVAGLCRAWGVPLERGRASAPVVSEEAARQARYAFLEAARRAVGAVAVLTAHHADDQAETVLFRVLRGTGQAGLAGIAPAREPGLLRPLLGVWRAELEAYAAEAGLRWREDPTNRDTRFARNALRLRVLPEIEKLVAPGARKALLRLGARAREEEAAWRSALPALLAPLDVRRDPARFSLDRAALLGLHPAVRARVLRALAEEAGVRLDEATTLRALAFAETGVSGRRLQLGGRWGLAREFDRLVLDAAGTPPADRSVRIEGPGPGAAAGLLGGRAFRVVWGGARAGSLAHAEAFDAEALRFPLLVRSREPGDRIRLASGARRVKDVLLERRIPRARRAELALVTDAAGDVLWIPDVARSAQALPGREPLCWIELG